MEKCDESNRKSCQVEETCQFATKSIDIENKWKKSLKSFINCCTKSAGPKNREKLIFVHKNVFLPLPSPLVIKDK